MPYRPEPVPPGATSPSLHVEHRHHAAHAGVGVVHRIDGTGGMSAWSHRPKTAGVRNPEALFDPPPSPLPSRSGRCRGAATGTAS